MSTRRELMLEKACEYQDEVMKDNPDGFHVSTYCNADMLANAFEEGWEAADKNSAFDSYRKETEEIIIKLYEKLAIANEKLKIAMEALSSAKIVMEGKNIQVSIYNPLQSADAKGDKE